MDEHCRSDRYHAAWRPFPLVVVGAVLVPMLVGCAYRELSMATLATAHESSQAADLLSGSGTLTTPNSTSRAITYNPALAPIGAAMTAVLIPWSDESSRAEFTVFGLLPNRDYAVYAHTKVCGATPDAAGPRFQNRIDPAATPQAPSSNPEYANPNNEIRLDVRTDATGTGTSHTIVPFIVTSRIPRSIVVYKPMQTSTGPGRAGEAGARIACLTLSRR